MSKLLEEAIEHVKALPEADQEQAQLAELRRRRADKNEAMITVEESRRRLREIGT
jgi:hypothetical protein